MSDWATISSLATAGGTLVLAVATFAAVRSGQRSARIAERSLLIGLRPVLTQAREGDPVEQVRFGDGYLVRPYAGYANVEQDDGKVYLVIPLRNVGLGMGILHGWHLSPTSQRTWQDRPALDEFRETQRDLYVPPGDAGFWQGGLRPTDRDGGAWLDQARQAIDAGEGLTIHILYGDYEGGQRTVTRFSLLPPSEEPATRWHCSVTRHWQV